MPPTRRRPIPSPTPVRRPRVAGLRHPEAAPKPGAADDTETTQVIPTVPEPEPEPEPVAQARPRPSGKHKPMWTTTPTEILPRITDDEPDEATAGELPSDDVPEPLEYDDGKPARRRGLLLPIALAVAAVLIGGAASWFGVQWAHARGEIQNTALVDAAGTSEVSGQVTSAISTVFSYNYTNMDKTRTAVQRLLTGQALCQYNLLFKVVQQQAPGQKLVLTTTVQAKGVEMLQGGTARVLLLLQQTDTRASTNQTSTSQSMIAVNAVKQGDTWKISAIDTLNAGDNPTAGCR